MKLPVYAINNYRFSLILLFLLVGLGYTSMTSMPRSEDPQYKFPAAMIRVVYPGTNPLDMEKLIVDPIEEVINELDDIKTIKSDIEDGLAIINVEFLYGSDPQEKYDDVVSEVTGIRDQLPANIAVLDIEKTEPTDVNILQVAMMSERRDYATLKRLSETLEEKFERVPGVKRATVEALPEQQLHVEADLNRMRALGISLNQLTEAIQNSGMNIPGGHVLAGDRRFTVRTSGDYKSIEQLKKTAVHSSLGSVIKVEDIASIGFTDALPTYEGRYDGNRAVFITVVQREGTNIMEVMSGLKEVLSRFEKTLPDEISIVLAHDQSESVDSQISMLSSNLLQGLILVGIMTFLFLGLRSAFVVALAIPLSVIIGLGWLDMAGFGLQQMSIAGMVIALGLLVDNAIVVTENVSRFLREGYSPKEAAGKGASQVGWAVISGTLTTILAFFPILGLQTNAGTFLRSMPVTVILTLIASLLIALTLTPLLASFLLPRKKSKAPFMLRLVHGFSQGAYRKLLGAAMKYPWRALSLAVAMLAASVMLAGQLGVSMFPKAEKPMLLVNIELPSGASFAQTEKMAITVEDMVRQYSLVRSVTTNIGKDNPRVYYNIMPKRQVPNYAQLLLRLHSGKDADVLPMIDSLRQQFARIPGATITVKELLQGPPYEAPIEIRVMGDDLDQVLAVSRDVEQTVTRTTGTINIDNPMDKPKVDLQVTINREKAAMYGVSIQAIDETIRASLVGIQVSSFRDEAGEDYPVIVRYQGERNPQIEDFDWMMVQSMSGALIPVNQLITLEMQSILPRFQHHMTERMVRITADVQSGYEVEPVTNSIIAELDQYEWPEGVNYQIGGEHEERQESFGGMNQVLLIALLGIFAILVLQFNSFGQSVVIFMAIPFSLTGMIAALWLTGNTFSFTAFIGLTSLVGIVVNNSIILVDFTNQLRAEGLPLKEAIAKSGETRMTPILLTTLTTIGGLLPLTLSGSGMWAPMGWTIIGGLVTSTLLTLILVPVLYLLFNRKAA